MNTERKQKVNSDKASLDFNKSLSLDTTNSKTNSIKSRNFWFNQTDKFPANFDKKVAGKPALIANASDTTNSNNNNSSTTTNTASSNANSTT